MATEAYTTKYHSVLKEVPKGSLSLSMLLGHNTFMFAVFADNYTRCIEVAHVQINASVNSDADFTDTITFLINNYLLHQKKFDKVNLTLISGNFTMVPEAFVTDSDSKSQLKFATGIPETTISRHHKLNGLSFFYGLDQSLIAYFENTFRNISIRHSGAVLINLFLSHHSLVDTNVLLNIHDSNIEIAVKEDNKLIFYNSFRFENNEDILYFLLFTLEQFELNPLLVKLSVAGQIDVSDDLAKSIKRYIKHLSFCARQPSIKLEAELLSLPHQRYFTLLNQHLCEL